MTQMPKTLTTPMTLSTPDGCVKMAKSCQKTADKFTEASLLLDEATKAFKSNDFATGCQMLKHVQDRLNRKD